MSTRPVLRPGFVAVRRAAGELQVGDLGVRAVLSDDADVRRLLDVLSDPTATWETPTGLAALRALRRLTDAGLAVPEPRSPRQRQLAAAYGASWPRRERARAEADVVVSGTSSLTASLTTLLAEEGVTASRGLRPRSSAGLILAATEGPVRRELLDASPGPVLPVAVLPDRWEIGPLVVPGRTACLRCVDATRSAEDPRLPLVVEQLGRRQTPVPVSPATARLGLGLAVREVLAWVDGDAPASWSATLTVPASGLPHATPWLRHPECGCAWDIVLLADQA